jgi:hypothetical protein
MNNQYTIYFFSFIGICLLFSGCTTREQNPTSAELGADSVNQAVGTNHPTPTTVAKN